MTKRTVILFGDLVLTVCKEMKHLLEISIDTADGQPSHTVQQLVDILQNLPQLKPFVLIPYGLIQPLTRWILAISVPLN
jgi:hypothetical protein